ncbi:Oligosaccharyl transferase STT3 subunit [Cyanobacterium stanieri PCC 7202]|uniref:Oligosaccharyl transferase STT3 subunit n=1 Tax=Cyanobacterium stanieri (strain ATCC 29140 / PCC 7202) TaxID=292563 RepID=K9YLS9_CYASC|nr:Oligosaccharyl transferase STT3 subunit [Cyanobacterium stanieri PCC 7202]
MNKNNTFISLLLILALAIFLRIFLLASIPGGFSCDEAANAYESYSIAETLRDRYGKFLPMFINPLKNDAKEALYFYLMIPFIKILGLNEFATRLPSVLLGVLTVLTVYFLAKEMLNKKTGLIAALLLSISPWHIHFNRIAFRLNLLPLLFCLGVLFFVKSFKQPKYLPLSSFVFALSLYTYNSARVFVPLFLLCLTTIFWKHLWQHKKETTLSLILFLFIFIPLLKFWISPEGMVRARGTGIENNSFVILKNYFSHFNPNFLFFNGKSVITENPSQMGELYLFEIITVPLGILKLLRDNVKTKMILLPWLLLYPIPAIFVGSESPQRSIIGVSLFAIISAIGIAYLIDNWSYKRQTIALATGLIVMSNVTFFSYKYFVNYPPEAAKLWNYGLKEAIDFSKKSSYGGFVLSSDTNSGCYAIHDFISQIPFYTQYSPQKYQQSPIPPWVRDSKDKVYSLGNYHLMSISKQDILITEYLYILRPEEIVTLESKGYNWKEIYTVIDSQGIEYFKLVEISI